MHANPNGLSGHARDGERAVLTLSRPERDLLWEECEAFANTSDPRIPGVDDGDVGMAKRYRRKYEVYFDLFDGLGWTREDGRSTFQIEVDRSQFVEWLREERQSSLGFVDDLHHTIVGVSTGSADYATVGGTLEDTRASTARSFDSESKLLLLYAKLLEQLGARADTPPEDER